ncbi:ABC transporter substrate-binding protein [Nocardia camponoti]|nr:ABC transporter substrate-binding protein [Nocardia camponoti]
MALSTRFRRVRVRGSRGAVLAVTALCAVAMTAGCAEQVDDASTIVRTTTNIAGAGVVGVQRDTTTACPLPSAADPASGPTRSVTNANGVTQIPADPQRIVALTPAAIDAACALGLWERVVGAVTLDGERPQPVYLGYGILKSPTVGPIGNPDPAKIAALKPDVILGDVASNSAELSAIAPTVLVGANDSWQSDFVAYAAGLGRRSVAEAALGAYRAEAKEAGVAINAAQSQASVLRFTPDAITIQGTNSFAGQVLSDVGVQRPTPQRGPSSPVAIDELSKRGEGDIIYVMFGRDGSSASDASEQYGRKVLKSTEFGELGAASDKRVFAVDDYVWHGWGLTAARALVTDLKASLNGYVTD